jgi:outer membrane protein assembly factor BamB
LPVGGFTRCGLSLKDGELLWGRPLALQGGSFIDADADPCVLGDVVFMASYADGVYALNAADGQTLWNQPGEAISSLLLHNDQLIAASADGTVWGMVPNTGAVRWRTQLNAAPVSRLLGDGHTIAVAAGPAGLVVLDGRDGQPLQATPLGERVSNDMRKVGNLLTFMSAPGHLYLWQRRGASARHGAEGVLQR